MFAYTPTQTTLDLISALEPSLTVYDVVDHFGGHPEPPHDLARTEEELLEEADAVFTTSPLLQELHEQRHPNVTRIHHGVSDEFFLEPREKRAHENFCYFGTLRDGIDYAAVNALAEAGFGVSLIGPEKDPAPKLHPKIERVGALPVSELTRRLRGFDGILLPYTDSEWNKGITPAKIYECLATGRPVLSSKMPGLAQVEDHLYVSEGPAGFVRSAKSLDSAETPERADARVSEARKRSTPAQFERIVAILAGTRRA